jgi:hypothetical protein
LIITRCKRHDFEGGKLITRIIPISLSLLITNALPALSEKYENIPALVRSEIKTKCVREYPDDYLMQSGCINLQSEAYIEVHGNKEETKKPKPEVEVDGIPSAFDRAQMNNAAYLSVTKQICKIEVGRMPDQYRERAVASDRLNAAQVDSMIRRIKEDYLKKAKRSPKTFCAEAKRSIHNFVSDLES